ncbi:sugar transferase, PEP-CTERM/EpsH1 system associated [Rhodoferax sp. OV413]|nr:sugar transferase, PEP-CTERM/EpsH1 system associated [Rhodoferax sp. OV413]
MCVDAHIEKLNPIFSKVRSVAGLLGNDSLSLTYYRSSSFEKWVSYAVKKNNIDIAVIFSSAMAQYVSDIPNFRFLVDFVDVDSAKWTEYANRHKWPMSWLYRREGRNLLRYESEISKKAEHSFFVTENEVNLFKRLSFDFSEKISALNNGVDAEYFSPRELRASPFSSNLKDSVKYSLVFTGAMDYWPNIDAVLWFVGEILPKLSEKYPQLFFYIVGRNPTSAVLDLASDNVIVTGTVSDVRPYLQHASVVVAPLRVARGIQNKILEAMAMARAVVASATCVDAIDALNGQEIFAAETVDDFVLKISMLLDNPNLAKEMGCTGRLKVLESYSWTAHLMGINRYLDIPETRCVL